MSKKKHHHYTRAYIYVYIIVYIIFRTQQTQGAVKTSLRMQPPSLLSPVNTNVSLSHRKTSGTSTGVVQRGERRLTTTEARGDHDEDWHQLLSPSPQDASRAHAGSAESFKPRDCRGTVAEAGGDERDGQASETPGDDGSWQRDLITDNTHLVNLA